jgi:hypothetical protein
LFYAFHDFRGDAQRFQAVLQGDLARGPPRTGRVEIRELLGDGIGLTHLRLLHVDAARWAPRYIQVQAKGIALLIGAHVL